MENNGVGRCKILVPPPKQVLTWQETIGINSFIILESKQILVDSRGLFDEKVATKF